MGNSETYDRRINIYINGKEITNDIKSIAAETRKATNELAGMTRGSAEYNAKVKEVQQLRGILKEHQDSLRETPGLWDNIKGAATSGLGMITAGIGVVIGAYKSIKGVIESTQGISESFRVTWAGIATAGQKFFQMIATGDLSNFASNLGKAAKAGKDYAQAQIEIERSILGLSLEEAQISYQMTENMREARDNANDATTRQEALNAYKKDANRLATEGHDIALKAVRAEEKKLTGLGVEAGRLKELYQTYNSNLSVIESTEAKLEKIRNLRASTSSGISDIPDIEGIAKAKKEVDAIYASMTVEELHYINLLDNNDKVKKGDLLEYITLLKKEGEAKNALAEIDKQTQRVQNGINTAAKKEITDHLKYLEDATNTEIAEQNVVDQESNKMAERAKKRAKDQYDWIYKFAMDEMALEHKKNDDLLAEQNVVDQESNKMAERAKKRAKDQYDWIYKYAMDEMAKEKEAKIATENAIAEVTLTINNTLYEMMSSTLAAKRDKELANTELTAKQQFEIRLKYVKQDAIWAITQLWIAGGVQTALIGMQSKDWKEFLRKAIPIGVATEAAIALVHKSVNDFEKSGKGLWTGGYTKKGGKYESAGIVHAGEWVANADMVSSPVYRPIIQALEYDRVNNFSGFANGGGPGMSSPGSGAGRSSPALISTDPRFESSINRLNRFLDRLERNGVNMKFGYNEADNVQKGLDKLENIRDEVTI